VIESDRGSILPSTTLPCGRGDGSSISKLKTFLEKQLNLLTQRPTFSFRYFVQA
jgi:hypothetical protein